MSFNLKLENNAPSFFPNLEMQAKQSTWHSLVHLETAESGGCVDGEPGPMSSPSNRTAPVGAGQNPSPILCDGRRRIFGAVGLSLVGCVRPASGRGSHPPPFARLPGAVCGGGNGLTGHHAGQTAGHVRKEASVSRRDRAGSCVVVGGGRMETPAAGRCDAGKEGKRGWHQTSRADLKRPSEKQKEAFKLH